MLISRVSRVFFARAEKNGKGFRFFPRAQKIRLSRESTRPCDSLHVRVPTYIVVCILYAVYIVNQQFVLCTSTLNSAPYYSELADHPALV